MKRRMSEYAQHDVKKEGRCAECINWECARVCVTANYGNRRTLDAIQIWKEPHEIGLWPTPIPSFKPTPRPNLYWALHHLYYPLLTIIYSIIHWYVFISTYAWCHSHPRSF